MLLFTMTASQTYIEKLGYGNPGPYLQIYADATLAQCENYCNNEPLCKGIVRLSSPDVENRITCWVRASISNLVIDSNQNTYIKLVPNINNSSSSAVGNGQEDESGSSTVSKSIELFLVCIGFSIFIFVIGLVTYFKRKSTKSSDSIMEISSPFPVISNQNSFYDNNMF